MKYFKIIHNRRVIDLLSYKDDIGPAYVRYQNKHGLLLYTNRKKAQGILSDNEHVYHTSDLIPFPSENMYLSVTLEEITKNEYDYIKSKDFQTADEIRQELLLDILSRGGL